MRLTGNFFSEWRYAGQRLRFRDAFLVALVAMAVGATASATVTMSLIDAPAAKPDLPPILTQAAASDTGVPDAATAGDDRSFAAVTAEPARDVAVTHPDAAGKATARNGHKWRRERRIGARSHKFNWRRFAHARSSLRASILSER